MCNGFGLSSFLVGFPSAFFGCQLLTLFELLHGEVQAPLLDVQVPGGRRETRVSEDLAHVVRGHTRLVEARTRFMTKVPDLEIFRGCTPNPAAAFHVRGIDYRWERGIRHALHATNAEARS